ncbi:MAG: 50S ribosomal protein L9 [Alphaproteobacteria bacterium]|nr:50S ribosomal protein L9 [Alphaproteobacteria bacterium]
MEVILLERIERLGQMGDVVNVRPGFARNFLLPQKKALRATQANREYFETQRVELEAANLERRQEAEDIAGRMEGLTLVVIRQAGESGQLYGSVSARDVAEATTAAGFHVDRSQVQMAHAIKTLGIHEEHIALHPEVIVDVSLNVAQSNEEAEAQKARGGSLAQIAEREAAESAARANRARAAEAAKEEAAEKAAEAAEEADIESAGESEADGGDEAEGAENAEV